MTMVAATVIAFEDKMPYFLVKQAKGEDAEFFAVKVHRHEETTSLGTILNAFKHAGVKNFDQWRIGELSAVKNQSGELMPLYSFEVSDRKAVQKELEGDLVFESADKIKDLLMTLNPSAFTSFEDLKD
ncbi:hypothetical protein [Eupransor demetentiae]|uniref:Uncharacterized protein n=1 Tax=Eupransor demetentiae TaxID=3109584 RepID=A0ABM9N613_9LACO|nr:hypothetical protein R54876_GBNLAHCA_01244 [Lactobacillaceae bacterium LMG 33000]